MELQKSFLGTSRALVAGNPLIPPETAGWAAYIYARPSRFLPTPLSGETSFCIFSSLSPVGGLGRVVGATELAGLRGETAEAGTVEAGSTAEAGAETGVGAEASPRRLFGPVVAARRLSRFPERGGRLCGPVLYGVSAAGDEHRGHAAHGARGTEG